MPSSASGSAETLPGSALGTPAYMSPEQAAGDLDRLGPASDVYSLGATLYCLLTGKAAVRGRRRRRRAGGGAEGRFPAASPRRPVDRHGPRSGLPQGDGDRARGPLRHAPGAGRRRGAVAGRRAGYRLARAVYRAGAAVDAAAAYGRDGGGGGAGGGEPWGWPRSWPCSPGPTGS